MTAALQFVMVALLITVAYGLVTNPFDRDEPQGGDS